MRFSSLDVFFHMASQGDANAYDLLFKEFYILAEESISCALTNYSKNLIIHENFKEEIGNLFLKILGDYDYSKGTFSWYVFYILNYKMEHRIFEQVSECKKHIISIDDLFEDERPFIEVLEDPNERSLQKKIAVESFKYTIASPLKNKSNQKRLWTKVMLLRYAGFNDCEIAKKLNITIAKLRYESKLLNKDKEIVNFKLELK